jgi:hypothetical protein
MMRFVEAAGLFQITLIAFKSWSNEITYYDRASKPIEN